MNCHPTTSLPRSPILVLAFALSVSSLLAQVAPPNSTGVTPATLAKYDTNKNGILDADELAAMQTAEAKAVAAIEAMRGPAVATDDEVVQLSPFEVNSGSDKGYAATSAMSGTRLNSKIEDLAASLSVVTKQQLQDTAAVDINDVFMYEANTESASDWTSFTIDRGTVSDDVQSNPYGATRMRGLSAANTAVDGFSSSLPFDTYNLESVEVGRGPNSTVFGPSQTGGGVNVNSSRANPSRNSSSVSTRIDSYGGYRGSFDFNRSIVKDKLAVRILGVDDEKGFLRKPSSESIRRLQVAVTVRPFKNTLVRASFESFRDAYNRPNSTTPRDGISDWISSGRPTYDPITRTVHFRDGRQAITGLTTTALENSLLPYGIAPTDTAVTTYPSAYIVNGQIERYEINAMPTATGVGPTSVDSAGLHLLTSSTYYVRNANQFPLFTTGGFTNKSLYDWTAVNLAAPNYGNQKGETSNVSFEQTILNSSRQRLTVQAAWQGERTSDNSRSFLGSYGNAGGKFQVGIDVNERLLDGTPNPYFLTPYLGYPRPGYSKKASAKDQYRSMLAYEVDLRHEQGFVKWLGMHRFSGYSEYQSIHTKNLGFVDTIGSDEAWMTTTNGPAGVPASRNSAGYRYYAHYMVGAPGVEGVQYGPAGIQAPPFSTTLRYYNGVSKQWINEPVDFAEYFYANRPNRRLLTTYGATWQASLVKDMIVPTFGIRRDLNRTRDANSAINPTVATDGFYILPDAKIYGASDWVHNEGKTMTKGVVVKPLRWLHLLYNQSDSFSPGSLARDVYGNPLDDPKGKTRDYGFQFILLDGVRFARSNTRRSTAAAVMAP
jgi:outer membrane receptor protein involved in Fe transport